MEQFMSFLQSRYVKYTVLSLFVGILLYLVLTIINMLVEDFELPNGLRVLLSILLSGYLVYRFLFSKLW
jgi:hypothetical protein